MSAVESELTEAVLPPSEASVGTPRGYGSESVNLKDYYAARGMKLSAKMATFSKDCERLAEVGALRFSRTISSPAGTHVTVKGKNSSKTFRMFGSNNYLGLASHPDVSRKIGEAIALWGFGVGGPPLLNGTTSHHQELERRLAAWKGTEDAVLFSSGFAANTGVVSALCNAGDQVFIDEYSHASLLDGFRMAGVRPRRFSHGNMAELEQLLKESVSVQSRTGKSSIRPCERFICIEGLYSMDGDVGKADEALALAERYHANLIIDDAHGSGVLGKTGSGVLEECGLHSSLGHLGERSPIVVGTLSKSFASTGGFVAATQQVCQYIRYFARSHMFSAAMNHATVAGALAMLDIMKAEPQRIQQLRQISKVLIDKLRDHHFPIPPGLVDTPIVPVLIPDTATLRWVSHVLHELGIFVNAIEFPAVPYDLQRIRISVMADHTNEDIEALIDALLEARLRMPF